ncbi:hypothetical protein BC938DRAFT_478394 [Jimgerdemannia flammicorona]|uniref:UPF0033 domain-containing protein n=1 Tax=Jimgerdemannia flammicorona TaxID=994334 RepID=A0A433QMZ4_9FUNG|nr:hypothetical protein BC938DRAFT_478394 [Jimgerdemannia flammicorona]
MGLFRGCWLCARSLLQTDADVIDNLDSCTTVCPAPSVTLNGFTFCLPHGEEWCHVCIVDVRPSTTSCWRIAYPDNRDSLTANGRYVILPNKKPACSQHRVVGCKKCFDFKNQIEKKIKEDEAWLEKRQKWKD